MKLASAMVATLGRCVLVVVLVSVTLTTSLAAPAAGQGECDPTFEPCEGFDDPPPLDEPLPEPPGPDTGAFCDPYLDPTCDPGFIDDPYLPPLDGPFCDPYLDPTCGGDPLYFEDELYVCDPILDPGCPGEPPADFIDYCANVVDPICDVLDEAPAPPAALAFQDDASPTVPPKRTDRAADVPAAEVPVEAIPTVAANRLVLLVDALAELGAFQRTPNPELTGALRQLRDDVPSDGLTDEGYREEVRRLAADLPIYIAQLDAAGVEVSPALRVIQSQLSIESLDALDSGATTLFDAAPMFSAIADLSVRGGSGSVGGPNLKADITEVLGLSLLFAAPEEPEPAPTTTTTTTAAPTTTVAPTTTAAPQLAAQPLAQTTSESGTTTGLWLGIVSAILLGAIALFVVLRRGRSSPVESTSGGNEVISVDDLLDASRRMTATLDSTEIVAIALGEAARLVDAEGGIVVMRDGDELRTIGCDPEHFFRPELAHDGALRRVVEAGRSIVTIATDEPVLVEVPVAMAAVSIVIDGTVAGSLMAVRIPSRPFDRNELEALEMLAPLVGSALHAAAAHDTATALVDVEPMTGLKNRRRLDRDMAGITDGDQVAYVMVDVDHFKNFNDVNGHSAGDEALRQVANALSSSVRPNDIVYRYGGEEFCVLLPATTTEEAASVAERARATVEALDIPGGENQPQGRVTISVGVADTSIGSIDDLIERADSALYQAKDTGRNRVCLDA